MISGLQKMTLLDYPGKVACTVFLQGCNFRCPFCHNSDLLDKDGPETIPVEKLMAFLQKRVGLLDAVCITGGEPTLQKDLPALIRQIKALGYLVKLDTNGSRPEVLKALVAEKLIDYVAMDIKNSPSRYSETVGLKNMDMSGVEESIRFLLEGHVAYEFRTTVAQQLHSEKDMQEMGAWLCSLVPGTKPIRHYIQPYVDRDSVLTQGLSTPEKPKLLDMADKLAPYADFVEIRGMD